MTDVAGTIHPTDVGRLEGRPVKLKGSGDELSIVLEPLGSEPGALEAWGEPLDDARGLVLEV